MYVYKTTNQINNKIYIGISKKKSDESITYLGSGKAFKRAINKYGRMNFSKEIIIEDDNFLYSDLQRLEIFFISLFDAQNPKIGYNISKGGDGNDGETNGMFGKTHTEETKKAISNTMKEKAINGELHKNHAKFTEERKQEYSEMFSAELNPFYGKTHTEESKLKIREAIRLKFPPVNKVDDNRIIVKTYESITDVIEDGYRPDLVKKVLKGENKKHGGFYWEYI